MVRDKLSERVRKAILAVLCFLGGASASCRIEPPIVCDPPPPPSVTPMICDPPPPPPSETPRPEATSTITSTITSPTPTATPMICDPPPPPPAIVTIAPGQHFTTRAFQVLPNASQSGVTISGTIVDQYGQPLRGLPVIIEKEDRQIQVTSDWVGAFSCNVDEAGIYSLSIAGDETSRLVIELRLYDAATVEWVEIWDSARSPLPLAEVRTVSIVQAGGLTFAAETPWLGARYRWSVSGGKLVGGGESMVWQPPTEPGRYLLQVVADWGRTGLAVDAVVLVVGDDGSMTLG